MRITKDATERRQEILDTALEMILENGYEKTSVKDIVTKVGVAQGLFYYYFPSKEDMIKETCKQFAEQYIAFVFQQLQKFKDDPVYSINLLITATQNFIDNNSELLNKMHQKGNRTFHDAIANALVGSATLIVKDIIVLGNDQGKFNCNYPEKSSVALIYGIFSAIHNDSEPLIKSIESEKEFILFFVSRILDIDVNLLQWMSRR